ncbi:nuclear transport factor 2 family protein [Hamadaea tsunoensis]|uniref:nuclear transport factor 2 family protein n=1 Tax=Hamadaea tsunoensis TaxID=53368 RepID=UPI000410E356|nr:nuclear transport factor 2 family protein [Hamadaea tsunoensis]
MPTTIDAADRFEIADLFARLADVLDESRFDDIGTVYAPDVSVSSPRGGELRGLDEVKAFLHRTAVADERTHHIHSGVRITEDGAGVRVSASQLVIYYQEGEAPHRRSGLRLAYTAVRTPDGWRLTQGQLALAWTEPAR